MKKQYVIAGIILIIIIGAYFSLKWDNPKEDTNGAMLEIQQTSTSLRLPSQLVVDTVEIDEVKLSKPGFVVIREVIDGKLAQISEVSELIPAGITEKLTIQLLEIPRDEVSLIAVVYNDDGDGGFNPSVDTRALNNGQVVALYVETAKRVPGELFEKVKGVSDDTQVAATIVYSDSGYSPTSVTIQKGQTVAFVNKSSIPMWVASDPHPAHTILSSFDQFTGSAPGSIYEYTFDAIGTWKYHDHISPSTGGQIIVIEPKENVSLLNIPALPILEKNNDGYFQTNVDDFAELAENPDVTMINVHIPFAGDIPGTELSIPYNQTQQLLAALPKEKNAPIALYCRSGGMSAVAAKDLVAAGYTNIYDLNGGMNAYEQSGRNLIKNN